MYKYALVKLDGEGRVIETLKSGRSLLDLSHAALDGQSYPSVFVSREDLLAVLENKIEDNEEDESRIDQRIDEMWERIKDISDNDMIRLASKLQDALVEHGGYWDYLEDWLDDRGITVKEKEG